MNISCQLLTEFLQLHSQCRKPSYTDHVFKLNTKGLAAADCNIVSSIAKQWSNLSAVNHVVALYPLTKLNDGFLRSSDVNVVTWPRDVVVRALRRWNRTNTTPHALHAENDARNYPEPPKNGSLNSGEMPPPNMRSAVEAGRALLRWWRVWVTGAIWPVTPYILK